MNKLFENVEGSLKTLAKWVLGCGGVGSLILLLWAIVKYAEYSRYVDDTILVIYFVVSGVIFLASLITAWGVYAFAELLEYTKSTNYLLQTIQLQENKTEEEKRQEKQKRQEEERAREEEELRRREAEARLEEERRMEEQRKEEERKHAEEERRMEEQRQEEERRRAEEERAAQIERFWSMYHEEKATLLEKQAYAKQKQSEIGKSQRISVFIQAVDWELTKEREELVLTYDLEMLLKTDVDALVRRERERKKKRRNVLWVVAVMTFVVFVGVFGYKYVEYQKHPYDGIYQKPYGAYVYQVKIENDILTVEMGKANGNMVTYYSGSYDEVVSTTGKKAITAANETYTLTLTPNKEGVLVQCYFRRGSKQHIGISGDYTKQ